MGVSDCTDVYSGFFAGRGMKQGGKLNSPVFASSSELKVLTTSAPVVVAEKETMFVNCRRLWGYNYRVAEGSTVEDSLSKEDRKRGSAKVINESIARLDIHPTSRKPHCQQAQLSN